MRRIFKVLAWAIGIILFVPALAVLCLRWIDPPLTAYMLQQHWEVEAAEDHVGPSIYYTWLDLEQINPSLALAAVAAEDQKFPSHNGFDLQAIGDALSEPGAPTRGASTITQQVAKNLFLWPAKSYVRKGIEAYFTVWMELLWPKRRILEMYLNIAQFDDRVFGAGAAAVRLFNTRADQLSAGQCALLAASLPAPRDYSVRTPGPYIQRRQAWILDQMRQLGSGYLDGILAQE